MWSRERNAQELKTFRCSDEPGLNSAAQLQALDILNGRSIGMIGDSVTRYQYLALGHYLVHGTCAQDGNSVDQLSILNEDGWGSWNAVYKHGSAALTVDNEVVSSIELCFCNHEIFGPGRVTEMRALQINGANIRGIAPYQGCTCATKS